MSFWRAYYHVVWGTYERKPFITPEVEPQLYGYLVNKAAELGVYVYAINGIEDHVHLIITLPPRHALAYIVKVLKGSSSHYVNHSLALDFQFAWQRGYGALTLGKRQLSQAKAYVAAQKTHHAEDTTNAWLERCAELDEGPTERGIEVTANTIGVREPTSGYGSDEVEDLFPF